MQLSGGGVEENAWDLDSVGNLWLVSQYFSPWSLFAAVTYVTRKNNAQTQIPSSNVWVHNNKQQREKRTTILQKWAMFAVQKDSPCLSVPKVCGRCTTARSWWKENKNTCRLQRKPKQKRKVQMFLRMSETEFQGHHEVYARRSPKSGVPFSSSYNQKLNWSKVKFEAVANQKFSSWRNPLHIKIK